MLTDKEYELAKRCLAMALSEGASAVRLTLTGSLMDLCGVLNGELDKVTHALDRSLSLALFVDGRFGTFSTNRLEEGSLQEFVARAVGTVRMLQEDPCRCLPDRSRIARDARDGNELGLFDPAFAAQEAEGRLARALSSSLWKDKALLEKGFRIVSEEGEYSETGSEVLVLDSEGLEARHRETSFDIGYEVTVEDGKGNLLSGYWWDSNPRLENLLPALEPCSRTALQRAVAHIGQRPGRSGRGKMVVEAECAGKLLRPLLGALSGYSLQQKNSFLDGRIGQKVFPDCLTVLESPRTPGLTGAKLFDSEGTATRNFAVIDKGVVTSGFINTYIAAKTGMAPTVEDSIRPEIVPVGGLKTLPELLRAVGDGILVTGFNGGNSNAATGDFSYGVEGFRFEGGKVVHPVREMLITGNFIDLWNHLLMTADDARDCQGRRIPSLAFQEVDFSA